MITNATQLTTIDHNDLNRVSGGADKKKIISLDATNGLGEELWKKFTKRPVPKGPFGDDVEVINGTRVPREVHEKLGKILSKKRR